MPNYNYKKYLFEKIMNYNIRMFQEINLEAKNLL